MQTFVPRPRWGLCPRPQTLDLDPPADLSYYYGRESALEVLRQCATYTRCPEKSEPPTNDGNFVKPNRFSKFFYRLKEEHIVNKTMLYVSDIIFAVFDVLLSTCRR